MNKHKKHKRNRKPLLKLRAKTSAFVLLQYLGEHGAALSFIPTAKPLYFSEKRFQNSISKIKKEGLLIEKEGKIKFSDDGLIEYARTKIEKADPLPRGMDCIVVFDVPEKERKIRMFLTVLLTDLAFLRLQKSVWISLFDSADALDELLKRLKIRKWVRIFNGKERY